jgi:hypothetical protein
MIRSLDEDHGLGPPGPCENKAALPRTKRSPKVSDLARVPRQDTVQVVHEPGTQGTAGCQIWIANRAWSSCGRLCDSFLASLSLRSEG